ncbi:MAG TPA: hypothetical protein VK787_12740 [Puia sp.]|jgi:hypothetical protein|nr:hypothetical protein [Puia sp.]
MMTCQKHSQSPATTPDIYITGTIVNYGVLWNSGTISYLSDTTNPPSYAGPIFVNGNDMYIAGSEVYGAARAATYWKNGIATHLTSPTINAFINSIFVSGNDVYAVGGGYNVFAGTLSVIYWKNGVGVILDSSTDVNHVYTNISSANSIYVSDTDVYIGGENSVGAYYSKNGVVTNINSFYCTAIFVSGSDVYAVADEVVNNFSVASYWKNGTPVNLVTSPSSNSDAEAIFIFGSDIYVSGSQNINGFDVATYWKNGVAKVIGNQSVNSYGNAIFVNGADVYVAGFSNKSACYWKNGIPIPLSNRSSSSANSIYVK